MEKYSIHKLQKNDFDKLIPLMKDCFGMDVDIEYFKWKYHDNPAGFVEGNYALHNDTDEIVAYYGGIPQVFYINQKKLNIIQPCDAMTHSQHRRLGLFERLVAHCDAELKKRNKLFLIGFAGSKSTPGFIKFGWKVLFDVRNYFVLPFYVKLFYRLNSSKFSFQESVDLSDIKHLISKSDEEIEASLAINRSLQNYQWRIQNPLHKYHVSAIKSFSSDIFTSYVVYYIENHKIVLFDFYFSNDSEAKSLLKNIYIKVIKKLKVKGIISFCQTDSYWSSKLSSLNFLHNPFSKGPLSEKMHFVINSTRKDGVNVFSKNTWNVNSFDHDCL
jgi:hypothetical protein